MSENETIISPEFIEELKAHDKRFQVIDTAIKIDEELRGSVLIQMLILRANKDAESALFALAEVNPSDVSAIITLQSRVHRAKFIERTILLAREQAHVAEASIKSSDETMEDHGN